MFTYLCLFLLEDRYKDETRESRRASESSTYGGGSYDVDKRNRYSDEPRETDHYTNDNYDNNSNSTYNNNSKSTTSSYSSKKTTTSTANPSSGGGKFKVNIKNEPARTSAPSTSSSQHTTQVDFFGNSGPEEVFSSTTATFDAFGKIVITH